MWQNHHNHTVMYSMAGISAVYMAGMSIAAGASLKNIGITTKYFKEALRFITFPTIAFALLILAASFLLPEVFITRSHAFPAYQYVLLSVPLQELIFRGFCLWRCRLTFKNTLFLIVFNSLLFATYHIAFNNWWFVVGVFAINLFWSYAFMKYPNLYAFMLSHAVLGTIYLGLSK